MAKRNYIEQQIEPAIQKVVARSNGSYFTKREVVSEVLSVGKLRDLMKRLRQYSALGVDEFIKKHLENAVGQALQKRDSNGLRIYECYSAGRRQRRWMPLRAMTANDLRAVMQATRVESRALANKAEGYEMMITELEKLSAAATVNSVYDAVVPKIKEYRAKSA